MGHLHKRVASYTQCLLPKHMLDWFEQKDVQVKRKGDL